MYANLRAEMARKGITVTTLADMLKKSPPTISNKLNGKGNFTMPEAFKIKKILGTNISLDELFEKEA